MKFILPSLIFSLSITTVALVQWNEWSPQRYDSNDFIDRDVAIVGGGSSGTYSAVNLRLQGKSVIVIEKQGALGGHTHTYRDPETGQTIEYGVVAFYNIPAASDYFANLNITTSILSGAPPAPTYADFQTGEQVNVTPSFDWTPYSTQLQKYPYLAYSWNLPATIPADLLLPFSDFVIKYNLQSLAYSIYSAGNGFANILKQLTVHVMKMVDASYINSNTVPGAAFVPAGGANSVIYNKAGTLLDQDVLLSSTVNAARRLDGKIGGISLIVNTPTGRKLIRASKLLITCPPTTDNLRPFDQDSVETGILSQWSYSFYYSMVISNTGLPSGSSFSNANASSSTFNIPNLPAPYQIAASRIPGLYTSRYGSNIQLTEDQVKIDVTRVIQQLRINLNSTITTAPEFLAFADNSPFKLVVPANALKNGFYSKLNSLQGRRNTYYTGAAFISHDASIIWNFTSMIILPKIIATLEKK